MQFYKKQAEQEKDRCLEIQNKLEVTNMPEQEIAKRKELLLSLERQQMKFAKIKQEVETERLMLSATCVIAKKVDKKNFIAALKGLADNLVVITFNRNSNTIHLKDSQTSIEIRDKN